MQQVLKAVVDEFDFDDSKYEPFYALSHNVVAVGYSSEDGSFVLKLRWFETKIETNHTISFRRFLVGIDLKEDYLICHIFNREQNSLELRPLRDPQRVTRRFEFP